MQNAKPADRVTNGTLVGGLATRAVVFGCLSHYTTQPWRGTGFDTHFSPVHLPRLEWSHHHSQGWIPAMTNLADLQTDDDLDLFDLTCPSCGADLLDDTAYIDWRLCGTCNRHFWVSARERVQMFARDAVFEEIAYSEPVLDPLENHQRLSPADRQDDIRERSGLADALITGHLTLAKAGAVIAVLDPVLIPAGLGVVTADKLIAAIKSAIDDRLPMVVICGGGSLPAGAGLLTSIQPLRVSGAIAELHRAGLPLITVMTHPTGGNVLAAIGVNADLRLSEPGTDSGDELLPDELVERPNLLVRLETLLRAQSDPVNDLHFKLAGSDDGLAAELRAYRHASGDLGHDRYDSTN